MLSLRDAGAPPVALFNQLERACSKEMVTDDIIETLARAIHAIYLAESRRTSEPDPGRPISSYDELSDDLKAANRAHARDIAHKLRVLSCGLRPLTDWNATPVALGDQEVEPLAEAEHERWNADRLAAGWRWGPITDRARKVNRWINIPWARASGGDPVRRPRAGA